VRGVTVGTPFPPLLFEDPPLVFEDPPFWEDPAAPDVVGTEALVRGVSVGTLFPPLLSEDPLLVFDDPPLFPGSRGGWLVAPNDPSIVGIARWQQRPLQHLLSQGALVRQPQERRVL
jgi:hypothetical protein